MTGYASAALIAALLFMPSLGVAQKEPPVTKEVKEAQKFIASAMIAGDSTERKSRLERALNPLQTGMAKTPDNPTVWFTAGQVYAELDDFARADSAFDKAEQLQPAMIEEIRRHRATGWLRAAGMGEALMNTQKYDDAIVHFENAETLFAERPESKLNLGVLYANAGNYPKAEAAYQGVIDLKSPVMGAEDSIARVRYQEIATIRIAQLLDRRGVEAFDARRYDDAIVAFTGARKLNPHARDHAFNLAQSIYAKARDIEEDRKDIIDKKPADAKLLAADLIKYYSQIDPLIEELRLSDPTNEDLYVLPMRSYRVQGDLSADAAAKTKFTQRAAEMFKLHQAREVEVTGVVASNAGADAVVRGTLRNLKLPANTPVKVKVTLLALNGQPIGSGEVTVNAPAADLTAPFELMTKVTGEVAAWRYELIR
jgi:tetratricopeptide (TPR) repeat protein